MTLNKTIEFGKIFLKTIEDEKGSATYEFVETAVKMMEQACENCISREDVLDKIKEVCFSSEQKWVDFRISQGSNGQRDFIIKFIESLPSVTPHYTEAEIQKMQELEQAEIQKAYELGKAKQPKTGHWIKEWNIDHFEQVCSECGCGEHFKSNYCPNCGCRIIGGSE